jgi:hypothetical protein
LSVATRPAAAAVLERAAALVPPLTLTDGSNTLAITDVQLVLREIALRDERLEAGPILLELPLGLGAAQVLTAPVAAGTYDEIEFEIHPPSDDDASDAAFEQAHPELDGLSIKVIGTYNGEEFTYTSNLDAKQEIELSPPLVASDTSSADLTLLVDLDKWFRDSGGLLVDPATAAPGQANASLVSDNIRATLHAFEDEDHDGAQDDAPGHD